METAAIHDMAPPGLRSIGGVGEDAAVRSYLDRGFRLLARNWRCPLGEIDVVLARGGLIVFCEVKTRSGSAFGGGFEAVGPRKQRKLRQLAEVYLLTTGTRPARTRFDVASVHVASGRSASVEVFEDAF
ncbi:MAG: YraN family protein [Actinomycetota bacterium]